MGRFVKLGQLLERRSVWELLGGYAVAAWIVLQIADTLGSLLGLPLWFGPTLLAVLAAGLVVVGLTGLVHGGRLGRLFTWRHTLGAGAAAFLLLVIGTASWMALRSVGFGPPATLIARGTLPADGQIVLADFEDHVGDPGLASALQRAFRVHLSQSPTVALVPPARVNEIRELMEVDEEAPFDQATAREAAIRAGWHAVLAGELDAVGSRYTVSVRLLAADSGTELAAGIESADAPDALIPAIERLSVRIRERIGESLASLRRSPELQRVRTSSLAALRSYSEGAEANERGQFDRCVLLMNDAIERDSTFAMAFAGRAACLQNLGRDRARQIADRIRAYEMRDRMTEEERLRFEAIYHQFVTRDRRRAVDAWEAFDARFPARTSALFSLANLYAEGREWERAERMLLRGLELDPSSSIVLLNLAGYQVNQGRWLDAAATYRALENELPGLDVAWWRATMHLATADFHAAEAELKGARERTRDNPARQARIAILQSRLYATVGRMEEAERHARDGIAAALELGSSESFLSHTVDLALLQLGVAGDTAAALALVDEALASHPLDALEPFERPFFELAEVNARGGRTARARTYVERWRAEIAPLVPGSRVPHWLEARISEAEGRDRDAIAEWRRADDEQEDPLPALVGIGAAFDRLGQTDSAIAYYRRYLETPSRERYNTDPWWRGPTLERLGRLLQDAGRPEEAAPYYAQLAELWSDADPPFRERATAAEERLAALGVESPGASDESYLYEGRQGVIEPVR